MIKTILWDFDGVILDSMKIKGDGFVELFHDYKKTDVKILEKYHYKNGGVSRFEKIRYFYEDILNEQISEENVLNLANNFASIIKKKIFDKKNLIIDSLEFIKKNYEKFNFHIVSGAEHIELNNLCDYLDIKRYFISIHGSPIKKDILIKNIIIDYKYSLDEIILIGDAMSDYRAAKINNILFYAFNNIDLIEMSDFYINDFKKLTYKLNENIF